MVGKILAGWRYDISGIAPEMRGDYEHHFAACERCRSRQKLHRMIDLSLIALASLSAVVFLLSFGVIRHFEPRHTFWLELAALAGAAGAAVSLRLPVLLDGYAVAAAAVAAVQLDPLAVEGMLATHRAAEPGHDLLLTELGLEPLLDLRLRLGEASGALLAGSAVHARAASATPAGVLTWVKGSSSLNGSIEIALLNGRDVRTLGPGTFAMVAPDGASVAVEESLPPADNAPSELLAYPARGDAAAVKLYHCDGFLRIDGWSADSKRILASCPTASTTKVRCS